MKLNGWIFCYTENKPTEENLCERDLSLDLGDTGAAVSPPLAGGLWTWRTKRRQEPSVLRLSKVAAESLRCKAGSAATFALDAVWKHLGRVPPMGTPSAGLKWWHRPFLHRHSLSLRRERALNGEAAVQNLPDCVVGALEQCALSTCAVSAGGRRKQTGTSQVDHKSRV